MFEDFFLLMLLLVSSVVVYQWAHRMLWFQLTGLFRTVTSTSRKRVSQDFPLLDDDTNSFLYKLYSEYSVSSHKVNQAVHFLFSAAMVCYIDTVEVILWQMMTAKSEVDGDFVCEFIWPVLSQLMSLLLIALQPFMIIISVMNKFFNDQYDLNKLIFVTTAILASLIIILNSLTFGPFKYTESTLTKVSIAGVSILAILSGIATISTLHYTYQFIKRMIRPSRYTSSTFTGKTAANALLWTTEASIREKISDFEMNIDENLEILRKLQAEGEPNNELIQKLMEKVAFYELELSKVEHQMRQPGFIRTGKRIFQVSFTVYCLHKLLITFFKRIPHIIEHSVAYPTDYSYDHFYNDGIISISSDPLAVTIANILNFIVFNFQSQEELDYLTKQISLLISTSLFICTLSTVATTISYLLALMPIKIQILTMHATETNSDVGKLPIAKNINQSSKGKYVTAKNRGKEPSLIKNLLVSELAGIYVVATSLTIRSNLPLELSQKLNILLGERFTVPNLVIDSWFDEVYAVTCIVTFLFIRLAERTLRK